MVGAGSGEGEGLGGGTKNELGGGFGGVSFLWDGVLGLPS